MSKEINVVKKSIYWASIEKALQFLLSFFVTTILAREIGPSAFGLVALAIVFEFLFLYLMESGLSQVIIQKKDINSTEINTAFSFNVVLGTLFTVVFYFSSDLLAGFFKEALLSDIVKIMSVKIFLISLSRIHVALLEKYFKFKRLACISVPVRLLSGIFAVYLVFSGFGIWAFIYYNLVQAALLSFALFLFSGHKVKFQFSTKALKDLLPLGIQFSVTRLLNTLSEKLYYIVIGKYFSVATLGLYQRADIIRRASSEEFAAVINRVFLPFFSKQGAISDSFNEYFRKLAPFYSLFFFIAAVSIICLSDILIQVLLGEEWSQASIFLKFLAVLGFFNSLNLFLAMIRKSSGCGKELLNETIFERLIRLVLLIVLLGHGLTIVILGQIVGSFLAFIFRIYKIKNFLNLCFLKALKPFLLGVFLMGFVISALVGTYLFYYEYFNLLPVRFIIIFLSLFLALFGIKFFYLSEANFVVRNVFLKNK
jgi:O-antigen/teichoic acid export membrane protein